MQSIVENVYYILTDSDNPSLRYFPNNAEVTKLAHYLVSKGVIPKQSHVCKCPVCHGRGFLPGNFYELPGQSVSYAGYTNLSSSSVSCRSCQGKGFVELEKSE